MNKKTGKMMFEELADRIKEYKTRTDSLRRFL